jgi:hypothetical protein
MSDVKVWLAMDDDGTVTLRAGARPDYMDTGAWMGGGVPVRLYGPLADLVKRPGECRCYRLVPVDPEEES